MAQTGRLETFGLKEGALLPAIQATIGGSLAGLATMCFCLATKNSDVALIWGGTGFFIVAGIQWFVGVGTLDKARLLVAGENQQPAPLQTQKALDTKPFVVQMIAVSPSRGDIWSKLPVSKEQLYALSVGMIEDHARFKVSYWGGGEVFREKQFDKLVDMMVANKYAEWKNSAHRNLGVRLTEQGCVWIESIYCHYYKEKYNKLPHPIPRLDRGI